MLEAARRMYEPGIDLDTVRFHLYEKEFSKEQVDPVIEVLRRWNKEEKRKKGLKKIIYGASFLAAGLLASLLSFREGSPVIYVLFGLMTAGVMIAVKGLFEVLGG